MDSPPLTEVNLSDHRIITKEKTKYEDILKSNRVEYRTLGTGILVNPRLIDKGIKMIKKVIHLKITDKLIDLYYKDLERIDYNNFDIELCDILKNKLIKNNDWNR